MTIIAPAGRSRPALGQPAMFVLLAAVTLAARIATFGNPALGFDEQFYLLVGDRMLQGALPCVDIFDRKPVGIFLIYAGARLLGGEGFVQYKLLAAAFVAATAFLTYRTARHRAGPFGAALAGIIYILWLDFMEGEGGQTPVFYNLLMLGAGSLLLAAGRSNGSPVRRGCAAMLLVGLALQIKYTVLFEGVFFGCAFLFLALRQGMRPSSIARFAVAMVALALLPTLAALGYYGATGHLQDFLFCNFVSGFGQSRGSPWTQLGGLAGIVGLITPLVIVGALGGRASAARDTDVEAWLLRGWLAVSVFGVLIYWRFNSPHYAMPILVPACLLLAPALDARQRLGTGLAIVAFVAGQVVLSITAGLKGGSVETRAVAEAARPRHGCIFVYNAPPALYMLTHSCLPSRWAFPGHMNAADEAAAKALGVDPSAETRRILDRRPEAIVDTYPVFEHGNRATHALVEQAIRDRYALVACIVTPRGKVRLVYRPRGDGSPRRRGGCPAGIAGT